jgi:MtN3 and saliva related transmembrane protein
MSFREIVTWIFGMGLICNALLFVPQIFAVWRKKSDEGVSLITFGGFSLLQIVSVIHGLYEHDWAMVIGMGASLLSCGSVTLLTCFFRVQRLRRENVNS